MWTVAVLFIVGIVFIVAEFVVPGAILGIVGGICLIVSTGLGWYWFPESAFFIIVGEFTGLLIGVMVGMYLLANSRIGGKLIMGAVQDKSDGYSSPAEDSALVGREGEVYSSLRPAGAIVVDGRRVQAVSNGTFIDKGARIRVIDVEGHRVVVEPLDLFPAEAS